jgi:hypothetical protein
MHSNSNQLDENEERHSYNVSPNVSDHAMSDDDDNDALYNDEHDSDRDHDDFDDDDINVETFSNSIRDSAARHNLTAADIIASGINLRPVGTQRRGATVTHADDNTTDTIAHNTANAGHDELNDATEMFESNDDDDDTQHSLEHESEVAAAQLQQQYDAEASTATAISTTDTAPDAYKVSGAGYPHVNGVYKRLFKASGAPLICDKLPVYGKKVSTTDMRTGKVHYTQFTLYRCSLDNKTRRWFISIIKEG